MAGFFDWENAIQNKNTAQWIFGTSVLFLAFWLIHSYLAALAWAGVIALASWPLYRKFERCLHVKIRGFAPFLFTLLVALLFLAPLAYVILILSREFGLFADLLSEAQTQGFAAPEWLARIPLFGDAVLAWWNRILATPGGFSALFHQFGQDTVLGWLRFFGTQMMHRAIAFLIAIFTLFFLYRDGEAIAMRLLSLIQKQLGSTHHAQRAVDTVRGTVNGLVLISILEGILLGLAYAIAGINTPALWGALTGLLAVIPFGMPALYGAIALILFAQGNETAALAILIWGTVVMLISDHVVRPILMGSSTQLSPLWIVLGILGGIETFGLLGIFLGPVIMATLISLWREWTNVRDHPV